VRFLSRLPAAVDLRTLGQHVGYSVGGHAPATAALDAFEQERDSPVDVVGMLQDVRAGLASASSLDDIVSFVSALIAAADADV
jgi:hypothetical protein